MRWRAEVFYGRVMTVSVRMSVDNAGLTQAYIELPFGYYTPPFGSLRQPEMLGHESGPFESIDAAYAAAFGDCRRCILQDMSRERSA